MSIGEWAADQRTLSFTTPVDAPAMVKRMIGKDSMRVLETQRRRFGADGSAAMTSLPEPDMPGGAKFATQAVLTFTNSGSNGSVACKVGAASCGVVVEVWLHAR